MRLETVEIQSATLLGLDNIKVLVLLEKMDQNNLWEEGII